MPSEILPFLAGYSGGILLMFVVDRFVFAPKRSKLGYLAGYCDAHLDIRDEVESLPSPDVDRPWDDERWYPSARRHVLEMQLEETGQDGDRR